MRVLRIARVLKLLKMAKGIRALLDTVMQALPQVQEYPILIRCSDRAKKSLLFQKKEEIYKVFDQVGNLGLLFFLLFFIFAALGVELFGRLGESLL